MSIYHRTRCFLPNAFAVCTALAVVGSSHGAALAQGKLDAQYEVTLAGIQIGKGNWAIEIADDQYSAMASGRTTGLIAMLSTGLGQGGAQGRVVKGQFQPANYSMSMTTDKKKEDLTISLAGGNVKDFSIVPPPPDNPNRVPVTEAHKKGVIDPMTGSLVRVPGAGELVVGPDVCAAGQQAVFDGRMRYDLKLEYKRMETIKPGQEQGYQGPVVVCTILFTPIAGHVPDRAAVKYLIAQKNMEVWLAPIAGTRVLAPYRVVIPTPVGTGVMQATRFNTTAQPRAALPASIRTN